MSVSAIRSHAAAIVMAAGITAGLAFGTSQLFANSLSECEYPPYHGVCIQGEEDECEELCRYLFPENGGVYWCSQGCCLCAE
jgi:hypothetical protein